MRRNSATDVRSKGITRTASPTPRPRRTMSSAAVTPRTLVRSSPRVLKPMPDNSNYGMQRKPNMENTKTAKHAIEDEKNLIVEKLTDIHKLLDTNDESLYIKWNTQSETSNKLLMDIKDGLSDLNTRLESVATIPLHRRSISGIVTSSDAIVTSLNKFTKALEDQPPLCESPYNVKLMNTLESIQIALEKIPITNCESSSYSLANIEKIGKQQLTVIEDLKSLLETKAAGVVVSDVTTDYKKMYEELKIRYETQFQNFSKILALYNATMAKMHTSSNPGQDLSEDFAEIAKLIQNFNPQ